MIIWQLSENRFDNITKLQKWTCLNLIDQSPYLISLTRTSLICKKVYLQNVRLTTKIIFINFLRPSTKYTSNIHYVRVFTFSAVTRGHLRPTFITENQMDFLYDRFNCINIISSLTDNFSRRDTSGYVRVTKSSVVSRTQSRESHHYIIDDTVLCAQV